MNINASESLLRLLFFWQDTVVKLHGLSLCKIQAGDFVPHKQLPKSTGKKILSLQIFKITFIGSTTYEDTVF